VPKMEPPLIAYLPTADGQMMTSLSTRERYVTFLSAMTLCSSQIFSLACGVPQPTKLPAQRLVVLWRYLPAFSARWFKFIDNNLDLRLWRLICRVKLRYG
jgi:hypothetical protein